jgi:hypothetical protein
VTRLIHHRANSLESLKRIKSNFGAEIDLRLHYGRLILAHEPLEDGCDFVTWLSQFDGSLLVVNVKEMGLEDLIVNEIVNIYPQLDYFFLDQSTPYLMKSLAKGYRCAARISEYETVDSAFLQKTNWLWVDSFTGDWTHLNELKRRLGEPNMKRKICLVSPELQGRTLKDSNEVLLLVNQIKELQLEVDAICTKNVSIWEKLLL